MIEQPTQAEKDLISIQKNTESQLQTVGQKIANSNLNPSEIDSLVNEAEQTIQTGLNQLAGLNLPEKAQQAAANTMAYLQSARQLFSQIKAKLSDWEKLKQQGMQMGTQAKELLDQKLQEIQSSFVQFSSQMKQLAQNLSQTAQQFKALFKENK